MPYLTYSTTRSYDSNYASFTSSSSYQTSRVESYGRTQNLPAPVQPHVAVEGGDGYIPDPEWNPVKLEVKTISGKATEAYTAKPFAPSGGQLTLLNGSTYSLQHAQEPSRNVVQISGASQYVSAGRYTLQAKYPDYYEDDGDGGRRYVTGESIDDQGAYPVYPPNSFYQCVSIEYTTDGYSTATSVSVDGTSISEFKGVPEWELTSITNQQFIGGKVTEGTSWVTASSFNSTKPRTQIVERETSLDTKEFTIGRASVQGDVGVQTRTTSYLTRSVNTISKYSVIVLGNYDHTAKAILNYPYNISDTDSEPIRDTIYLWTKTTMETAGIVSWEDDAEPAEFESFTESTIVSTEVFFNTYNEAGWVTNSFDPNSWQGSYKISDEDSTRIEFQAVGNGIKTARKEGAEAAANQGDATNVPTRKWNYDANASLGKTEESFGWSRTIAFPKGADTMREEVRRYVQTEGKSNSDGQFVATLSSSTDTVTIQSSTLIQKIQPWHSSLYAIKLSSDTEEQGEWRRSAESMGVTLSTGETETVVKQEEIIHLGDPARTDNTEMYTISGLTEQRAYHKISQSEVLPIWEKVSPTTQTINREELAYGALTQNPLGEWQKTGRKFKSADVMSYTEDGEEKTYLKYTATTSYDFSEGVPARTTGWSTEYIDSVFSFTYETEEPEMFYRKFRFTSGLVGKSGEFSFGDFGNTKFRNIWCESIEANAGVFPDLMGEKSSGKMSSTAYQAGAIFKWGATEKTDADRATDHYTTYSAALYPTFANRVVNKTTKYEWKKSIQGFQFVGRGNIEAPYVGILTGKTGWDGFITGTEAKMTGKRGVYATENTGVGATYSKQYAFMHLENTDFQPYRGALRLTTQVLSTQGSMLSMKRPRILVSTQITDTFETYFVPYTRTIEHDEDGWMSWCASDYDIEILRLNTDSSIGCHEVWYSDDCDNTKNDFLNGGGMGDSGNADGNNYEMWYWGADGVLYDENGMPADPNDPDYLANQTRDPSCGEFTWTFVSTSFDLNIHTIEVKSTQEVTLNAGGYDLIPEYRFAQDYYGNMLLNGIRYTTGDINQACRDWWNPVAESDAKWHFAHMSEAIQMAIQSPQALANIVQLERTYFDSNLNQYPIGEEPEYMARFWEQGNRWFAPQTFGEEFRSQLLFSFTTNAGGFNNHLEPKYNYSDFEGYFVNNTENRHHFIDARRNVNYLDVENMPDKTFQIGAFAKAGTTQSASKSWSDAIIYSSEKLGGGFKANSSFYKKYLQNKQYSFGDAWSENADGKLVRAEDMKGYTSFSRSVDEMVSGQDGVWRPVYGETESNSTLIDSSSFDYATAKTYLYGSFIATPNNRPFELGDVSIIPKITPCHTYNHGDTIQWLGAVMGGINNTAQEKSDIYGQYRRSRPHYIAEECLTIGLIPFATHFDMDFVQTSDAVPFHISVKNLWDTEWTASSLSLSNAMQITADDLAVSYSLPKQLLFHRGQILGLVQKNVDTYSIHAFMSIRYATIYEDYAPIGAVVNKKDEWLNHHNIWNNNAEFAREDLNAIFHTDADGEETIRGDIFVGLLEERNSRLLTPANYAVLVNQTNKVAPIYP